MSGMEVVVTGVRRERGLAKLTLSSGEVLAMPRAMLKEQPYRSDMPFDRAAFDAFLLERAYPFAMEKAVALLAVRARTEKEIVDALRKNAYPERAIARVMAYLGEAGYLSDAAFAQQWAATRSARGMGARRIRMELRHKGVRQEEIEQALDALDEDDALAGALRIAEKAARGKDLSNPADRRKVFASLARRGYDSSVSREAIESLLSRS